MSLQSREPLEVCGGCQSYHLDRASDGRMHCRYCEPEAFADCDHKRHTQPTELDDAQCLDCGVTLSAALDAIADQ